VLDKNGQVLEQKNQALVSTGDFFVAWGHGKHASPGRFFASQELKLMLAHIVMNYNYDVRIGGTRRSSIELATFSAPSPKARLQVRLR
jgi:cytochrome P450